MDDIPALIEYEDTFSHPSYNPVPLTIITGYLGSGKSSVIKRILTERHGYRIAVIMNEFGDTADIEAKTINVSSPEDPMAEQTEEFLELANGCLCCSIKDSGVAAIEKLMRRKGAFDYILLETTGLADPGPIATMFWQNEEFATGLGKDISLDGVICVVDAMFGREQMEEDQAVDGIGESLRQIACADVVLLNKIDLVSETTVSYMEELLHKTNPLAAVHRTIRGQIDLASIIGIAAYSSSQPRNLLDRGASRLKNFGHTDHDHDSKTTHYEIRGISSLQVSAPVMTRHLLEKLDEWIRTVLWENRLPDGAASTDLQILRCKGLFITDLGEEYVLQGVKSMYELSEVEHGVTGVPYSGKLVIIGKGLDDIVRKSLEDVFQS